MQLICCPENGLMNVLLLEQLYKTHGWQRKSTEQTFAERKKQKEAGQAVVWGEKWGEQINVVCE